MTDEPDAPEQPIKQRGSSRRRHDPGFITKAAHDTLSVSRAFGPAYERDGVRVIPVARVMGGTGSGYGGGSLAAGPGGAGRVADTGSESAAESLGETHAAPPTPGRHRKGVDASGNGDGYGGGGGFGAVVKPLGVVVIDDSGVHWQPTIDVNRAILGGQIVLALAVLTAGCVLGRRRKTVHRLHLPSIAGLLSCRASKEHP